MTDHIMAVVFLGCIFYTSSKLMSWIIDVFMAKFITTDKNLGRAVSALISLISLRWGGMTEGKIYTLITKGYVITAKKNTEKDK